jgi:transaldolase / glucose-6-phosphate isomerase
VPAQANPCLSLGALVGLAARQRRPQSTLVLSQPLSPFESWIERLPAESTHQAERPLMFALSKPLGRPEVYGDDRVFVSMQLAGREEAAPDKGLSSLEEAGHPVVRIVRTESMNLGAEFFRPGREPLQ